MARYYRATRRNASKFKNNKTMGKMFRTRGGRYGCYVYINGRRSHFEPAKGSQVDMKMYYKNKRR
jgi:hypothetical protein